jgi:hypothetical protein
MSIVQIQAFLLMLINSREHSLQSVEKAETQSVSGLWMLVSIKEYALTIRGKKILLKRFNKKIVPVLIEPQKNLLIYNFGKRSYKPFRFTYNSSGIITVPHFRTEIELLGHILRSGDKMTWELKYFNQKHPTVVFEFQLVKE